MLFDLDFPISVPGVIETKLKNDQDAIMIQLDITFCLNQAALMLGGRLLCEE